MRVANVLMLLPLTIWSLLLLMGWSLYHGASLEHVPGYPNSGQFRYYVLTPLIVLALLIAVMAVCNRLGRFSALMFAGIAASIVFLGPYLMAYTGGV